MRSEAILSVDEVQVAIARSPSAPSLHTPSLLHDVGALVAEIKAKGCDTTAVDAWPGVKTRVMLRANVLGHEWSYTEEPAHPTGPALGSWVGDVYPDDSVAVVWWTDQFIDYRFRDHSYETLVGQTCSTWDRVAGELQK